ncbi:hypothetical protein MMC07_006555 [Pseudocyphellaria aurata]|nr:hypothetical protein [Pseudocyphellaria aurata]
MSASFYYNLLHSQLFITPPVPTKSFSRQTAIVTGSNTGLGFEAAQHLVRLGAEKVILGVRTVSKGEAARIRIEENTKRVNVVEVWPLELESYESVKQFAKRAESLRRLDVVIENAGVTLERFRIAEQDEATVTINVTSTFLLALLLLPKLQETSSKFNTKPRITVVTSDLHFVPRFEERNADSIFDELNHQATANMSERYAVTKLLEVFGVRELAELISASSKPRVIVTCVTPGGCHSDFDRESGTIKTVLMGVVKFMFARTTEVGSRTLVAGAAAGEDSHGKFMAHGENAP